jgi:hypothetical protein
MTNPSNVAISKEEDALVGEDLVKKLAPKVLEVLLFSGIQVQSANFDASIVYHMIEKMM